MIRIASLLLLLSLPAQVLADPAPDPQLAHGRLLALQCQVCHTFKPGEAARIGPNLAGIIGAAAASRPGFSGYSPALKASGLTWNAATLDRWLAAPSKLVPGTRMAFTGIATPADRAAVIAYLASVSGPAK